MSIAHSLKITSEIVTIYTKEYKDLHKQKLRQSIQEKEKELHLAQKLFKKLQNSNVDKKRLTSLRSKMKKLERIIEEKKRSA